MKYLSAIIALIFVVCSVQGATQTYSGKFNVATLPTNTSTYPPFPSANGTVTVAVSNVTNTTYSATYSIALDNAPVNSTVTFRLQGPANATAEPAPNTLNDKLVTVDTTTNTSTTFSIRNNGTITFAASGNAGYAASLSDLVSGKVQAIVVVEFGNPITNYTRAQLVYQPEDHSDSSNAFKITFSASLMLLALIAALF